MNILTLILQTASTTGNAQAGNSWFSWIMIVAMFLIMWLFMIRPQRKQQKQLEEFRNSLKKGDKVITAGGIYGTVAETDERTVLLKVDGDVKIRVDKSAISRDGSADAATPAEKK